MAVNSVVLEALRDLGAELNMDLTPDANGVLKVSMGGDVDISMEAPASDDLLYIYAPLDRLPVSGRLEVLERAMKLNMFRTGLSGVWLSLDDETDSLQVCTCTTAATVNSDALATLLAGFCDTVLSLRRVLVATGPSDHQDGLSFAGLIRG